MARSITNSLKKTELYNLHLTLHNVGCTMQRTGTVNENLLYTI